MRCYRLIFRGSADECRSMTKFVGVEMAGTGFAITSSGRICSGIARAPEKSLFIKRP